MLIVGGSCQAVWHTMHRLRASSTADGVCVAEFSMGIKSVIRLLAELGPVCIAQPVTVLECARGSATVQGGSKSIPPLGRALR
jgi:hypothetical protein